MLSLTKVLDDKLALLDRQLAEACFTRDHAATPTESHFDQTRQNAEQFIYGLLDEKKNLLTLKKSLAILPSFSGRAVVNSLVTLRTPLGNRDFLLVPDGLGGQIITGVTLLSEKTPLATSFLGQKPGYTFTFNGGDYQIVFVHPNS